MESPLNLLPGWLAPDDQPGDWYQWAVVASGHLALGLGAYTLVWRIAGPLVAWGLCLGLYLVIEALQLAVGGGLLDGLTDALFVTGGMMAASEALKREPYGFAVVIAFMALAGLAGVAIRS